VYWKAGLIFIVAFYSFFFRLAFPLPHAFFFLVFYFLWWVGFFMGYLVFSGSTMEKGEGLLYRGFFGVPAFLLSLAKLRSFLLFFLDFFF